MSVFLGILAARRVVRHRPPRAMVLLSRLHTGSVNDYAGFAVGGIIAVVAAFLL
ncbi:hypothetical protein [Catenulispora subtropica]|uniref:Uncharacterized protein n=1 Tax=Catenulispora subtropica TaxID=450798 RepID=A0ABN2RN98_9ACTN